MALEVLLSIWVTKTEAANRLRRRIEAVLDALNALHWRMGRTQVAGWSTCRHCGEA